MGWVFNVTPRPLYPRERDPVPIVWDAGWVTGPVWKCVENLIPTGIRSPIIQPIASHYTDCAIRSVLNSKHNYNCMYSFYVVYTTGLKMTLWCRNVLPHCRYHTYCWSLWLFISLIISVTQRNYKPKQNISEKHWEKSKTYFVFNTVLSKVRILV